MRYYTAFPILLTIFSIQAQQPELKSFQVKYINDEIFLDGNLDESIWEAADTAADFWEYFPADSILAREQSEIPTSM